MRRQGRTEHAFQHRLPLLQLGFTLGSHTTQPQSPHGTAFRGRRRRTGALTQFSWPIRVYYEDTDAGGVVYHANYLKFFERARTEWLRALGFEQDQLKSEHGLLFVVHDLTLRFHAPARFNDQLTVTCDVLRARGASMDFRQQVHAPEHAGLLCEAKLTVACIDEQFKPRPVPRAIRAEMQHAR